MAKSYKRRISISIDGKEVEGNIKSITDAMRKLTAQQARMTIGSKEYVEAGKKIAQLKGVIAEHNKELNKLTKTKNMFQKVTDSVNKMAFTFAASLTFLNKFIGLGKQTIQQFAEFDDIVGRKLKRFLRRGIVVLSVIVLCLLFATWVFKYLDIITAPVGITNLNPPEQIIARSSGNIQLLLVSNNEK